MRTILIAAVCFAFVASARGQENWPQWRGPSLNGVAAGSGYALKWDTKKNVRFKIDLTDQGSSTPVVWGDNIFLTTPEKATNLLYCFNFKGEEKWRVELGGERKGKHRKASGSNPSPATDGKYVYVYFKSGQLACVDFRGKEVWSHNLQDKYGKDTLWWDLGTSPVLTKNHVVVACMHSGPSYVAAFDKKTGKVVWRVDRNLKAPVEAAQSYTTPTVGTINGKEVIYIVGADHVTAHKASDGKEIWRVGGLNPKQNGYFRSISSPVLAKNLLIAPYARGRSLTAVRLGGKGDVTKSHVVWTKRLGADVPTPSFYKGSIYVCSDRGVLTQLSTKGDTVQRIALPRARNAYSASPMIADGHLFATREDGTTFVVKLGKKMEIVAKNELEEFTVSTPIFVRKTMLLRTSRHLYAIGAPVGAE